MLKSSLAILATLVVPNFPRLQASILRDLSEPALFTVHTEGRDSDLSIKSDPKDGREKTSPPDPLEKHYGWSINDPQHGVFAHGSTDATATTNGSLYPSTEVVVETKIKDGGVGGGARDFAEAGIQYKFEVKPAVNVPPVSGLLGWVHIKAQGSVKYEVPSSGDVVGTAFAYMLIPELMLTPVFPPRTFALVATTVPGRSGPSFDFDEKVLMVPGKYEVAIGGWVRVSGENGAVKLKSKVDPIIEIAPESEGLFELHISSNLSDVPSTPDVPEPSTSALAGASLVTFLLIRKLHITAA